MSVRRLMVFFIAVIFVLTTVVDFAAGDRYVVVKDGKSVRTVIKVKGKRPQSVAPNPPKPAPTERVIR